MILGTLYFPGRFLSCGGAHTAPTAHIRAVGPRNRGTGWGGIAPSQELRCITTNFMGCLPLAVTTHFCLTRGFKRSLDGTDQSTVWKWLGRHLMVLCTNEIAPSYIVVQLNLAGTLILFKSGGDILCPTYYNALFPQISRPSYGHVLCILCTKSFAQINETILHCTSYIPSHTLKVR